MAYLEITGKIVGNKFIKDNGLPTIDSFTVYQITRKDNLLVDDSNAFIALESALVNASNQSLSLFYYDELNDNLCVNAFQIASTLGDTTEKWNTLPKEQHTNGMLLVSIIIEAVSNYPASKDKTSGVFAKGVNSNGQKIVFKSILCAEFNTSPENLPTVSATIGSYFIGTDNAPSYSKNAVTLLGKLILPIAQNLRKPPYMCNLICIIDNVTKKMIGMSNNASYYNIPITITDNGTIIPTLSSITSTSVHHPVSAFANYMLSNTSGNNDEFYLLYNDVTPIDSGFTQDVSFQGKTTYYKGFLICLPVSLGRSSVSKTPSFTDGSTTLKTIQQFADSVPSGKSIDLEVIQDYSKVKGRVLKYTIREFFFDIRFGDNIPIIKEGTCLYLTRMPSWKFSQNDSGTSFYNRNTVIDTITSRPVDGYPYLSSPSDCNFIHQIAVPSDNNERIARYEHESLLFIIGFRSVIKDSNVYYSTNPIILSYNTSGYVGHRNNISSINLGVLSGLGFISYITTSGLTGPSNLFIDISTNTNIFKSLDFYVSLDTHNPTSTIYLISTSGQSVSATTAPTAITVGGNISSFGNPINTSSFLSKSALTGLNTSNSYWANQTVRSAGTSAGVFPTANNTILIGSFAVTKV